MNEKITAIAIDDEPQALQLLASYAERIPFLHFEGIFRNPFEALPMINSGRIELMFLDLNMPEIDGLSFYRSLKYKPRVIFTTAYTEFAAESYEVEALDYLLKPVEFQRFVQAFNKYARKELNPSPLQKTEEKDSLYLKSGTKWIQLKWAEIVYLEKSENYMIFHTSDNRKVLNRQNMNDAEEMIPEYFCRIHRSYIINTRKIDTIEREEVLVAGQPLPIGEAYKELLLKKCGI